MSTAVKIGVITALALLTTGSDNAAGKKFMTEHHINNTFKTAIKGGQSNLSSTDETNDHYLFPLTKTVLTEL
jgi:hypothetical protein